MSESDRVKELPSFTGFSINNNFKKTHFGNVHTAQRRLKGRRPSIVFGWQQQHKKKKSLKIEK